MNNTQNQEEYPKIFRDELSAMMQRGQKLRKPLLPEGITHSEIFALQEIYTYMDLHPGKKGIYVSELAKALGIALPAVSRTLNALEERELIYRQIDIKNRRNIFVSLTKKGEEIRNSCVAMLNQMLDHVIVNMGEKDARQLILLWKRFFQLWENEIKNFTEGKNDSE